MEFEKFQAMQSQRTLPSNTGTCHNQDTLGTEATMSKDSAVSFCWYCTLAGFLTHLITFFRWINELNLWSWSVQRCGDSRCGLRLRSHGEWEFLHVRKIPASFCLSMNVSAVSMRSLLLHWIVAKPAEHFNLFTHEGVLNVLLSRRHMKNYKTMKVPR